MFSVYSSWIPVDSGRNPPEFLEFRGIPGFRPESAESGQNQWRNGKYWVISPKLLPCCHEHFEGGNGT